MNGARYTTGVPKASNYRVELKGQGIFYIYVDGVLLPSSSSSAAAASGSYGHEAAALHVAEGAAGKGEGEGEGHGKADVLAFGLVLWEMATVCQRHGHHSIAKH